MTGCANYEITSDVVDNQEKGQGDYISLRISRPGVAKAPFGGQYGDGTLVTSNLKSEFLKKVDYEYKLDNLCVFILKTGILTLEEALNYADSSTEIIFKAYVDDVLDLVEKDHDGHPDHLLDASYISVPVNVQDFKVSESLHDIVVVGNMGDVTAKCKTIGDLRALIAEKGFTKSDKGGSIYVNCKAADDIEASDNAPSQFAMGLYEEPGKWIMKAGTYDDPHLVSVTLERVAARVDYRLTSFPSALSQKADAFAPIPYDVQALVGGNNTTLARNWVTHTRLINVKQDGSYALRRTANDPLAAPTGTDVKVLGQETHTNHLSTNYVLAPTTHDVTQVEPVDLFGTSALDFVRFNEFESDERVVSRKAFTPLDGDCNDRYSAFAFDRGSNTENYYIIGYANENTLRTDQMTRKYTTGILYRSIFEPATVWRYDGDAIASTTVDHLTTDVLSDGTVPDGGYKSAHYGKTFWMIERLVPNPTEADRVYFMADADGEQDDKGNTTPTGKTRIQKAVELYISSHNDTGWTLPLEFVGGVAYNYYWIRHSNSQGTGHPFSPMEYSIVRNNIYSIGITSFTGPGAPSTDPTMDNPDRIQPLTYVHKWHPYTVEEVGM